MTASSSDLVYQVAASSDLPATQRYEHWLRPLLSNFEATAPNARQSQDFQGHVTSLMLGARELHDAQLDDFQGAHSKRDIQAYGTEKLALIYVMHGSVVCQYENDIDTVTGQGQFFLYDGTRPNRIRFHQPRFVQINLPRTYLHKMIPRGLAPSQVHKAVSRSGLGGLLASQLTQFRDLSGRLTEQERYSYLEASEALAAGVLESALTGHHSLDRHHALYIAAQRYIQKHLSSGKLNGHSIAAALRCSRSTLYRVLTEHGISLAEQIRELRLQKLASLLQHSSHAIPIAHLAHSCGLQDAPNLSRMFRRRFGVSPQEYRAARFASTQK